VIRIRKASERGQYDHGWLQTAHTFSFADYYDPENHNFRSLRVINEDRIAGGGGFPDHSHRDMEIVTYVLEGRLEHKDSLGNRGVIAPGLVQRMSAGTGITHSEFNASATVPVHLYQIWIMPNALGIPPGYEERALPDAQQAGKLVLVASPDGAHDSLKIHADARLFSARLNPGHGLGHHLRPGRSGWLQVMRGAVTVSGIPMQAGDGAAITELTGVEIKTQQGAEVLLFDLA